MPSASATFHGNQPGQALNPKVIRTVPAALAGPHAAVSAAQASMTRLKTMDGTRKREGTVNAYSCDYPQSTRSAWMRCGY
jgi:hypothetical protein